VEDTNVQIKLDDIRRHTSAASFTVESGQADPREDGLISQHSQINQLSGKEEIRVREEEGPNRGILEEDY
jgi:hypothetical protein